MGEKPNSCKVVCVGAQLQLSPKKEDQVTKFSFAPRSAPLGKPGDAWPESQVQLYEHDGGKYQVGQEYEMAFVVVKP